MARVMHAWNLACCAEASCMHMLRACCSVANMWPSITSGCTLSLCDGVWVVTQCLPGVLWLPPSDLCQLTGTLLTETELRIGLVQTQMACWQGGGRCCMCMS
jgi:hypothetical protein